MIALTASASHAQVPYNDSPWNYKNSEFNYENSSYNYKNSVYNYDNSPINLFSPNAIYDNQGNRVGYRTQTEQGVTNYYDNQGNRKGYSTK